MNWVFRETVFLREKKLDLFFIYVLCLLFVLLNEKQ